MTDQQRIVGTWSVVGLQDEILEEGGAKGGNLIVVTPESIKIVSRLTSLPTRLSTGNYKFLPTKGQIDFDTTFQGKTNTHQALYEVTDDTFKLIWCAHNDKHPGRPTQLATVSQSVNEVMVIGRREDNFVSLVDLAKWNDTKGQWKLEDSRAEGAVLASTAPRAVHSSLAYAHR